MLKLSEFSHNHHPSGVKLLENFIRRGIWVLRGIHRTLRAKCYTGFFVPRFYEDDNDSGWFRFM